MNKIKKISAAALAAALMTGTAVTANGEESQTKLLVCEDSLGNTGNLDGGYFRNSDGFFKLGEEELAKWRETGKFTTTSVECNVDLTDFLGWTGSFEGKYLQYAKKDADGNITERKVVHLDKENNKIELAYTLGVDWCYTRPDGYTVFTKYDDSGILTYGVYDPNGTKTENTIAADNYNCSTLVSGEYVGFLFTLDEESNNDDFEVNCNGYAIKKSGELISVYTTPNVIISESCNSTYVMYHTGPLSSYVICDAKTGKTYEARRIETSDGKHLGNLEFDQFQGDIYGTKAIIKDKGDYNNDIKYVLVDIDKINTDEDG